MKSTRTKSKIAGLLLALIVLTITLGAIAVTAFAAEGGHCTSTDSCTGTYANGFCSVCNGYEPAALNAKGYYEIASAGHLFWYANYINTVDRTANAVLTADIDLEDRPWTPIGVMGEDSNSFHGVFDGQNHTIKGLNVTAASNGAGFFGEVRTGTVKNFTIYGNVVVNTEVNYVGGVIGSICGLNSTDHGLERNGAIIQNITSFVNVTAKAHGIGMIGGFVGYADHQSLIEKCSWYGTFDAGEYRVDSGAGGFIGKIQENTSEVTIRNCGAYGTIKTNYAGDYNNTATIYMGGFLSFSNTNAQTTLENCLFAGRFERGENLTDQAFLGAFGTLRSVNAIKNCYYLGDDGLEAVHSDSNLKPGSDNVEITSVTKAQLLSGEVAYKLGEHFGQTLEGENRQSYPVLGGTKVEDSQRFEIYGQQLGIGADLSMKYYVMGYAPQFNSGALYMEFRHNGVKTKVYAGEPNADGFYVFVLEGINPQCMGDSIRAMLCYNETEVASHGYEDGKEYSVEKNLLNLLEKYKDDATFAALIKDTLAYGEAASAYKNHQTMTGNTYTENSSNREIPVSEADRFEIESDYPLVEQYTVRFGTTLSIKIKVSYLPEVKVYVNGKEYVTTEEEVNRGWIIFESDPISATDFDKDFSVIIQNDKGENCSYIHVSVNDYLYAISQSTDASDEMKALAKALYNYGLSAHKYAGVHTGGEATCTHGKLCDICGVEYGEKDTTNHASDTYIYVDNGDGTHTKTHECGVTVGEPEYHTFTYSAKDNVITAACSANCGYSETATISAEDTTYNGTEQKTATVTYSDGWKSDELNVSYENNVNAGTATASITVGEATASVDFTIEKATVTVTADAMSKTYGTDNPPLTYTTSDLFGSDTLTGALETTATKTSSVGEYDITVGSLANSNYTIDFVGAKLTITKAAAPNIAWPTAAELTYGQKLSDSALTSEDENGTFAWQDGSIVPTVTNDGFVVVYTPKDTHNYDYSSVELTKTISVTVSKVSATVTAAPTPNTLTYTGEGQYLISAGEANGGTMQYSTDNQTWSTTISQGTDAGKYTVYYKVVGDENHSDTAVDSIEVTIAKADPVIGTVGCEMALFDTTAASAVELKRTDMTVDGTLILTDSELTAGEGTYSWKFTPDDTDNYNTITGTVVLTVTADVLEQIRATGTLEKFSYVYGEPFSIDGMTVTAEYTSGTTKDVTGLVSFDRTLAVGQTAVELTYGGKTCIIDGITVARKQLDVSGMAWDVPENAVYSGTAYTATLTGDLPEGVTIIKTGDTATNAGSYTAKAVFSLAEGYSADNYEIVNGEDLTAEWSIDKAALTVTAGSYESVRYGSAAPVFAANYSGFVNGETEAVLGGELVFSCEYDTADAAKRKPGNYPIVPGGLTSNNYEISYVDGNLDVISANLVLVIDDKTVTYGDAAPEYTYHYEGFVYGEDISVMDEPGTVSCAYVPGNAVGTMEIKSDNYGSDDCYFVVNQRIGTLTVEKAPLIVTAKDNTITYGDKPSASGVEYSGFVNNETESVLTGTVAYSYNYEQFGNVGTYKITPVGLTSDNYEITFADGTLTVNAKAITVTADAVSKTYGDTDPALTYTAQGLVNGDELTGELNRAAGENVGSYAIEQNTLTAGNNYSITYTGANLTINAKAITEADVELSGSLTYTGEEQTQPITVTEGITYEVTGNKATNVGAYELTVKGIGNYTGEVKLSWSIKKTAAVVTNAPTAKTLTYTSEARALVNAGTTADGELVYSLSENGEFTDSIPTGTNAGEYTVWYYVQGDDNHSDTAKASVKVTIAKADPVIGTVGCEMDLYDSIAISNVELTRTDMSVEGTLVLTDSELTAGEGTYNWKFTPKDTDNYNTITGTVVLNVTADMLEKIEVSGNLEKDSYSYGDTFSVDGLTVNATYTTGATKDVTELVSFDNTLAVGQTSVELTYQGKTCTVTGFTVAKKQLVIDRMAWVIPENAVYSGTAYNATLTGDLPEGVTVTKTGNTATNAGDYTAKAVFSLAEGYSADNYEIVNGGDLTADWTIAKKNIAGATITLGTALTYNGKQQTQTVTKVEIDGLTVTCTVSGNTGTDAKGYTLTVNGNGNFEGAETKEWSIAKKNISGATITLGDSLTYIGNEQTQEVIDVKIGDLPVTYDVTANKQTNAGNYTLTVTGNGNFEGSATADWSIAKAKLTITANNNSITYGDVPAANGVTGTGFVSNESIEDLSGELTYSCNYEQFGNVGTYKITPSGVTSNNYEITFADGTLTVNAKTIAVTADAFSKTYGDTDPTLTYKVEGLVNGDELTGELKRAAGENVGSYAIEQNTLTAGNNYAISYTGAKLIINKRSVTVAAKDQTVYYGNSISNTEITANGLVDGHSVTVTLTPSTANVTVDGTITASAAIITAGSADVTANYEITYADGKLVIEPDMSKIAGVTTDNVTSANEADIKAVKEMMANADSVKDEWADISTACEDLIEKIEAVEAQKKEATDKAASFNEDTVKSADKEDLTQLTEEIEALLDTDNLTEDERTDLETVLGQVNGMIDTIEDTAEESKAATDAIDALNAATVTSADKGKLEQAIETIEDLLAGDNLTEEEAKTLEDAKADAKALIDVINAAAGATGTENTEKVEDVTPENVTPEDKTDLEKAKADLEKALEDNGGNYTEDEKKAIRDEIDRIDSAITALENVESMTESVSQLPESVEPDDEAEAEKILAAKEAYDALTDHEKSLVGEGVKKKLDNLVASLTAYDIVKGDGSSWTEDSNGTISFTVNGAFSKFVGIKVDGVDVDKINYEARAGSTIITLKASYLDTLKVGEHTITVVYSDGSTDGTFKIVAKPGTPTTGDDFSIALYGSLMVVSVTALVVQLLTSKKRKQTK